jgi:predicted metal-dependent hydrolase
MAESRKREVDLLGNSVEYEVRRSDEATEPRIDVDIRGVTVVLPTSSTERPVDLLEDNAAWVVEKQREFDRHREQIPNREFENGESFPYLGDEYEVVVERRSTSMVGDGTLRLAKHHVDDTSIERALETLYRRKARETFEEIADEYAAQIGVEYEQIEIRNQRTKWGSCSTNGTLGLNWRLMMAPRNVVEYIVIHELAHLRETNHSDAFWSLVAQHDPDYETHAQWLDENSARLIFTKDDL